MEDQTAVTKSDTAAGRIPRIMIVDDDEGHLEFLKMLILRENFTCEMVLVDRSAEALARLRDDPPDLLLLDVRMPELDGFEVLARLREHAATRDLPVIFLTASQDTDDLVRAYQAGAVDYIAKPINSAVLAVRIKSVLQRIVLENELKERNHQLVQINNFKDELLSICSHDLRGPLAAIEVLCRSRGGNGVDGEFLDQVVNQSRLARRLVENLLNYDKIEEGMLVPEPTFFPVREKVQSWIEQERPMVTAAGLKLHCACPPEDLLAFGDHDLIAQAIRNVLGNATRYARETISLEFHVADMSPERGGTLEIAISDDGPGIPEEQAAEIFNKYAHTDGKGSGSGLGLYISRKVAEAHGGAITVASRPLPRTTFTLRLPHVFSRAQLPDLAGACGARGSIVTANKVTGALVCAILSEAGMVHIAVTEPRKGAPHLEPDDPADFLLFDLGEKGVNLFRLAKWLDTAPAGPALIGMGAPKALDTLHKLAHRRFRRLPTPLNPLELLNLVREELAGRITKATMREGARTTV